MEQPIADVSGESCCGLHVKEQTSHNILLSQSLIPGKILAFSFLRRLRGEEAAEVWS